MRRGIAGYSENPSEVFLRGRLSGYTQRDASNIRISQASTENFSCACSEMSCWEALDRRLIEDGTTEPQRHGTYARSGSMPSVAPWFRAVGSCSTACGNPYSCWLHTTGTLYPPSLFAGGSGEAPVVVGIVVFMDPTHEAYGHPEQLVSGGATRLQHIHHRVALAMPDVR